MILASNSPRRKEILSRHIKGFKVISPNFDEDKIEKKSYTPDKYVEVLSYHKALSVSLKYPLETIIAADTVVVLEGIIYGKPKDKKDAFETLTKLSNKTHQVMTGITVSSHGQNLTRHVVSDVTFKPLTDKEINAYIDTLEPMDKAGSYAIQGLGASLVLSYEGSLDNIIGLPLDTVIEMIKMVELKTIF